jgi:hypothetical protein
MKKIVGVMIGLIVLAGCSKTSQYTQDLTGSWTVYKLTYNNIENPTIYADSFKYDTITFTANGNYTERNIFKAGTPQVDTFHGQGKWQFQNANGQLALTDTSNVKRTYTLFNLTGNSMELLRNGYDRYMRKNQ